MFMCLHVSHMNDYIDFYCLLFLLCPEELYMPHYVKVLFIFFVLITLEQRYKEITSPSQYTTLE